METNVGLYSSENRSGIADLPVGNFDLSIMSATNSVSVLKSADFGKITSLAAGSAPRIMQFGMKFLF